SPAPSRRSARSRRRYCEICECVAAAAQTLGEFATFRRDCRRPATFAACRLRKIEAEAVSGAQSPDDSGPQAMRKVRQGDARQGLRKAIAACDTAGLVAPGVLGSYWRHWPNAGATTACGVEGNTRGFDHVGL